MTMLAEGNNDNNVYIEEVNKWYPGGVHAVKDVDMEIRDGEFLVFVGPSGCGKTTLLRMIAGLERISGGTIRMGGRVINKVPPKDRDMAMVFQNYALYPTMSVYENIAFPLRSRKVKGQEIHSSVTDVAERLGLTELLERRPQALSGGQRQRVALARAMVRKPRLFLMDEPLSNLDAKLRVNMRREIVSLQRELGVSTIYVTHDQTEAMTMGDRIAVMKDGVLQQLGTPNEIYNDPANLFTAMFIGSPPMNVWEGRVFSEDGALWATVGCHRIHMPPAALAYASADVLTLGFRPEHVMTAAGDDPERCLMRIDAVENTGREVFAYLKGPGLPDLTMAAGSDYPFQTGDVIPVKLISDKIKGFMETMN